MEELIDLSPLFKPPKPLDLWKLPPLGCFTDGPIWWTLNRATNKKQRKYYAAMFILGQPFNYGKCR